MNKTGLIIISGGMDSTTLLYQYKEKIKMAVSFYYGQKHNKELDYAKKSCDKLGIPWQMIDITAIGEYLKSDLLQSGGEIPEGHYEDISMKRTVVPFRNGIMLSIAAGIAESNGCDTVYIANHHGDYAIYPDCREEFVINMHNAIKVGTYAKISLKAPYTQLTKRQVAEIGLKHEVDYRDTWSCYKGKELHCGKCGTCVERKEALEGFDPTEYEGE